MSNFEDRMIELESRLAFQDDSIQQLSDTLAVQQKKLDDLTLAVKMMNEQLKSLPEEMRADTADEAPPHY